MVAAFRLGIRLSAALISKNVGLVDVLSPSETKDILTALCLPGKLVVSLRYSQSCKQILSVLTIEHDLQLCVKCVSQQRLGIFNP